MIISEIFQKYYLLNVIFTSILKSIPTRFCKLCSSVRIVQTASLSFLSLTPQTLSIHHPSSATAGVVSASSLFAPSSLKPLPKLVLSLNSTGNYLDPSCRFIRNVAISFELDSEVDEDEGFDYSRQQSSPPELKLYVDPVFALNGTFDKRPKFSFGRTISIQIAAKRHTMPPKEVY
ncbi:hypothetical protein CASFOL_005016 [Castilleja foliolosa]|uniref:Uncharacterized protein n=1 Tax=Castilleja foliolosa TaxID=1961234 RepID=A0ABD3E274_9LAMI